MYLYKETSILMALYVICNASSLTSSSAMICLDEERGSILVNSSLARYRLQMQFCGSCPLLVSRASQHSGVIWVTNMNLYLMPSFKQNIVLFTDSNMVLYLPMGGPNLTPTQILIPRLQYPCLVCYTLERGCYV